MKILEIILEIFGWLVIVSGTTAAAALIAFLIYNNRTTEVSKLLSIAVILIGFLAGVIWATSIWKKHGTIKWLSGIRRIS